MKKQISLIVVMLAALVALCCVLCACTGASAFNKKMSNINKSLDKVTQLTAKISVTHSDTEVYRYVRTTEIPTEGTTANAVTEESQLSPSTFQLSTVKQSEVINDFDRATLNPLSLNADGVTNFTVDGDVVSCTVAADKLASALKISGSFVAQGDAAITCTFDGKTIQQITCSYVTESGKNVSVVFDYIY